MKLAEMPHHAAWIICIIIYEAKSVHAQKNNKNIHEECEMERKANESRMQRRITHTEMTSATINFNILNICAVLAAAVVDVVAAYKWVARERERARSHEAMKHLTRAILFLTTDIFPEKFPSSYGWQKVQEMSAFDWCANNFLNLKFNFHKN